MAILPMKRIFTLLCLCTLVFSTGFFLTSCKEEDEEAKIEVEFTTVSKGSDEGDTIRVQLRLKAPAIKTEYVTLSVTSSNAVFGVDYGIDNLLELKEHFTVKVSKDSTSASFSFISLEDFEDESMEDVKIKIDEMSSGLILGSQNSCTVSIVNAANYSVNNRTILFDGVDDYIDLGNIYDNVTLPLTISAWIWLDPNALPGSPIPIFDSQDGLPKYNGFNFLTSTASIAGVQYGDGLGENNSIYRRAKSAIFSPVAGRWVNFTAVMKTGTDMSIYFNGVDVGGTYAGESDLPMSSNSPTEVAKIGYLFQNGMVYRFKGKIDELKIWNRALSLEEIQKTIFRKSPSSEQGLIGYWDFDEPTGATVLDHSSNHFNGMIKGNAARVLSEVPVH